MGSAERKGREREERRKLILESAQRILIRKGLSSATMQDIADGAELGVGTLYLYFQNKEEIFERLYVEGMDLLSAAIRGAAEGGGAGAEKIERMAEAYYRFHLDNAPLFDTISYFFSFPEIQFPQEKRKSLAERGAAILDFVRGAVAGGIASREFARVDPLRAAILLWSSLHGLLQFRKMRDVLFTDLDFHELYLFNARQVISSIMRK